MDIIRVLRSFAKCNALLPSKVPRELQSAQGPGGFTGFTIPLAFFLYSWEILSEDLDCEIHFLNFVGFALTR